MTRFALYLIAAALLSASPALGDPVLRPAVTVTGSVLRLGDLFADAGPQAGDPVAAAPAPGMRIAFGADWLAATAHEHKLAWSPSSSYDQSIVVRASRVIGADEISQRLRDEIAVRQSVADAELQLDNPGLRLVVAADAPDTVAFDGLGIDQRTGRVSAFVSAPAGDPAATRQRITGRIFFQVELPVPNHSLAIGATIAASDLDMAKLRRDRVGPDVATDGAQLVGRTLRRALRAAEPVRLADVQLPVLVHKGELVTIVLETTSLQLTAQGKALEDGAKDSLVRIENTKSGRVIDAAVSGPGTVVVRLPGRTDLAAQSASR